MSYEKKHKPSDCDKCLKTVGEHNLFKVPFLYLDKNDNVHPDQSPMLRMITNKPCDDGYRQYYVCNDCIKTINNMELERKKAKK